MSGALCGAALSASGAKATLVGGSMHRFERPAAGRSEQRTARAQKAVQWQRNNDRTKGVPTCSGGQRHAQLLRLLGLFSFPHVAPHRNAGENRAGCAGHCEPRERGRADAPDLASAADLVDPGVAEHERARSVREPGEGNREKPREEANQ